MNALRTGSLRWWFEDRDTGGITIVQFPNWPIWAIAVTWIVSAVVDAGSTIASTTSWVRTGLWVFWAADEIVRGVNPWRRLLGAVVISWQFLGLVLG